LSIDAVFQDNHHSKVLGIPGPSSDEWILSFDFIIIADLMLFPEVIRISDLGYNNHRQFILATTIGPCSVLLKTSATSHATIPTAFSPKKRL
jgi:hypothetical protein